MQDYGKVEDEGTPGYHSARIGLRAPWVAVRVETRDDWLSMFALAMSMASGLWGGYGFIYLPRQAGELHPARARVLTAYDPDYLVDALLTHGNIEAMEPGWHARNYETWPTDPDEAAAWIAPLLDEPGRDGLGEDIGANLCSPFYERDKYQQPLPAVASVHQASGRARLELAEPDQHGNAQERAHDSRGCTS